jgi:hypothetical protein
MLATRKRIVDSVQVEEVMGLAQTEDMALSGWQVNDLMVEVSRKASITKNAGLQTWCFV